MAQTLIEWTHRRHPLTGQIHPGFTFNPWIGCTKVPGSPACVFCYAATLDDKRFSKTLGGATVEAPISHWGKGAPRHRTQTWRDPLKWNRAAEKAGIALAVFCASLADVFDEEVPDAWRDDLFEVVLACPNLDWLLLTKRPEKARDYFARNGCPPHIWMGSTMENQHWFDQRIGPLLSIEGPEIYFASMEPLFGPLDPSAGLLFPPGDIRGIPCGCHDPVRRGLGWVIVGGESNEPDKTKSRPMHPDDALGIFTDCWAAGVPCFGKQWGDWAPAYELDHNPQAQAMCLMGKVLKRDLGRGEGGRRLSYNVGKAAAGHSFEGAARRDMPAFRVLS